MLQAVAKHNRHALRAGRDLSDDDHVQARQNEDTPIKVWWTVTVDDNGSQASATPSSPAASSGQVVTMTHGSHTPTFPTASQSLTVLLPCTFSTATTSASAAVPTNSTHKMLDANGVLLNSTISFTRIKAPQTTAPIVGTASKAEIKGGDNDRESARENEKSDASQADAGIKPFTIAITLELLVIVTFILGGVIWYFTKGRCKKKRIKSEGDDGNHQNSNTKDDPEDFTDPWKVGYRPSMFQRKTIERPYEEPGPSPTYVSVELPASPPYTQHARSDEKTMNDFIAATRAQQRGSDPRTYYGSNVGETGPYAYPAGMPAETTQNSQLQALKSDEAAGVGLRHSVARWLHIHNWIPDAPSAIQSTRTSTVPPMPFTPNSFPPETPMSATHLIPSGPGTPSQFDFLQPPQARFQNQSHWSHTDEDHITIPSFSRPSSALYPAPLAPRTVPRASTSIPSYYGGTTDSHRESWVTQDPAETPPTGYSGWDEQLKRQDTI